MGFVSMKISIKKISQILAYLVLIYAFIVLTDFALNKNNAAAPTAIAIPTGYAIVVDNLNPSGACNKYVADTAVINIAGMLVIQ